MPATPIYSLPYPGINDPPDGPDGIKGLANATETTIAATDATVSALDGRVTALESPLAVAVQQQASPAVQTTSTTYVTLTGGPDLTFIAPPSGRVFIGIAAAITATTTAGSELSWQLREGSTIGSGTIVVAAASIQSVRHGIVTSIGIDLYKRRLVEGLTPGAVYNLQSLYIVGSGNTAFFSRRVIHADPTA